MGTLCTVNHNSQFGFTLFMLWIAPATVTDGLSANRTRPSHGSIVQLSYNGTMAEWQISNSFLDRLLAIISPPDVEISIAKSSLSELSIPMPPQLLPPLLSILPSSLLTLEPLASC